MTSKSAGSPAPARGQVWSSDRVFPDGELADFLIISCDDWNRRRVTTLLGLEVSAGHGEKARFTSLITADGEPMTVYGDQVLPIPRAGLVDRGIELDARAMADVDEVLDMALGNLRAPRTAVPRPAGHPYRSHLRFADLHIPGEKDKPVVVVSSEMYGVAVGFSLVLACRVTSNPSDPHTFDVVLSSQVGKVVCSDLRTISVDDLRERTTKAQAVNATEREAIMTTVRRIVGLG